MHERETLQIDDAPASKHDHALHNGLDDAHPRCSGGQSEIDAAGIIYFVTQYSLLLSN